MKERSHRGFTLAETLLAISLLAIIILGVAMLSLTIIRSSTESNDRTGTAAVATGILDGLAREVQSDPLFWNNDYSVTPYRTTALKLGKIDYEYDIFAADVTDTTGTPIGSLLSKNRLKRATIVMTWFDTKSQDRQGYGKLEYSATVLISEDGTLP